MTPGAFADYPEHIATLAVRSILREAAISPKPGLVDRFDSGAHSDMDFFTFIDSAVSLHRYFREVTYAAMTFKGEPRDLLPALRPAGIAAESDMMRATGGVNTHRGIIFSLGLAAAAAGHIHASGESSDEAALLDTCAEIASPAVKELGVAPKETHGEAAYRACGLTGVRGEAAAGYPSVRLYGLPAYRRALREGCSVNDAGVFTLLSLMRHVGDTNIVFRAGADTLMSVQDTVEGFLNGNPRRDDVTAFASRLNEDFVAAGISPGGCADLLALTLMLHDLVG